MNDKQKAIAWAEYVLPIFEAKFPEDNRPRKAIVAAKNKTDYAASYAASAASAAAYAAYAAASAAYAAASASASASAAAFAVIRGRHGEDKLLIAKVNLLWSLEEQLEIANKIEWLQHKPTEVWQVLLKERW